MIEEGEWEGEGEWRRGRVEERGRGGEERGRGGEGESQTIKAK